MTLVIEFNELHYSIKPHYIANLYFFTLFYIVELKST